MLMFRGYFTEEPDGSENPERLEVYAITAREELVPVVRDVTRAGFEWVKSEMSVLDDGDPEQVAMFAAALRKRMPVKYSYTWRQMEAERLANLPLRRCNGTFKSQGRA